MKGIELKRIRARLGLTQRELAERLAVALNSVARWERDEVIITETMARFIRLFAAHERARQQKGRSSWPA